MKEFRIVVEETVSREVSIEAESKSQAIEEAIRRYKTGDIVLEPGDIEDVLVSVAETDGELSEPVKIV